MELRCIRPFGRFKPGDTVEVEDGALFDRYYFEHAEPEPEPAAPPAPPKPAAPAPQSETPEEDK